MNESTALSVLKVRLLFSLYLFPVYWLSKKDYSCQTNEKERDRELQDFMEHVFQFIQGQSID